MEFEITTDEFADKLSELYVKNKWGFKNVAVYYLKDFPRVPAELGLQFVRHYYHNDYCDNCILVFKVIDKQKFFLAKIKYGI